MSAEASLIAELRAAALDDGISEPMQPDAYAALCARAAEAIEHWKRNHDQMALRNAVLRDRPDLPADRLPLISRLDILFGRQARVRAFVHSLAAQPCRLGDGCSIDALERPGMARCLTCRARAALEPMP